MAEKLTLARPYAKALFEHAKAKNLLHEWSSFLARLDLFIKEKEVVGVLANPSIATSTKVAFLLSFEEKTEKEAMEYHRAFLQVLAENHRLSLLREIKTLYEACCREEQKIRKVTVRVCHPLTEAQEKKLVQGLSHQLSSEIELDVVIDSNLIGGVLLQADGHIMDASVLGALNKLRRHVAL